MSAGIKHAILTHVLPNIQPLHVFLRNASAGRINLEQPGDPSSYLQLIRNIVVVVFCINEPSNEIRLPSHPMLRRFLWDLKQKSICRSIHHNQMYGRTLQTES